MRMIWAVIVVLTMAGSTLQQLPTLDLTQPVSTAEQVQERTVTAISALDVSTTIVNFIDREYVIGDEFQYEVEICNTSPVPILIPWSGNPTGLTDAPADRVFEGSITLTVINGNNQERVLTGVTMYGRADVPSSTLTLAPGASARVRAGSIWSVAGLHMPSFIAPQSGRVSIRAIYRLQSGFLLASSASSAPQALTLRMR